MAVQSSLLRCVRGCAVAALVAAASACGGGGDGNDASPLTPLIAQAPAVARGTLLQTGWSAYPRLVRLSHQSDPARNGVIFASVTEWSGGSARAGFHASFDDGVTFLRVGTLLDGAFATGLCCGTLFEMPQAVGTIAAGTLL